VETDLVGRTGARLPETHSDRIGAIGSDGLIVARAKYTRTHRTEAKRRNDGDAALHGNGERDVVQGDDPGRT